LYVAFNRTILEKNPGTSASEGVQFKCFALADDRDIEGQYSNIFWDLPKIRNIFKKDG